MSNIVSARTGDEVLQIISDALTSRKHSDFQRALWLNVAVLETTEEIRRLRKENTNLRIAAANEAENFNDLLCPVLGYTNDPEYGWITGDHVPITLTTELVRKYQKLAEELSAPKDDISRKDA